MHSDAALPSENSVVEPDLGPLAWVLDELRKSLDGATKALKRFVRDAELSRGSDLAALDASQLRIARQQLHQAVGALEMVGLVVPAKMLRAMEALAQKFVQKPESCSDEAAMKVELASFALTDYLEGLLKEKSSSSVALFPQYRDVLELLGSDRVHPADLWAHELRWLHIPVPDTVTPLGYDTAVRSRIDGYVLRVVKSADVSSALALADIAWGFTAAQNQLHARVFWAVTSAFLKLLHLGCVHLMYIPNERLRVCCCNIVRWRVVSRISQINWCMIYCFFALRLCPLPPTMPRLFVLYVKSMASLIQLRWITSSHSLDVLIQHFWRRRVNVLLPPLKLGQPCPGGYTSHQGHGRSVQSGQ